ncbi:MAG: protein phosphatase 2C domain-containing protein [Intestinibacter bartlettii]|uniref:PP2C family protein-serine/threonine phosphatase n=1 Tax=Intestinibacter bartlettii TaxID=261299 RepID=UPI0026EDD08B|nr:protein phosphatase 2C domain-containing protein [Intestinibacter bartlettii]MDO5009350.1 protein phosphatase 2C domain-containing protein [Intestinibacter bartlettii]
MKMFNILASVGCNIGNERENNEDNFYLNGRFKENPNEKNHISLNSESNEQIQVYAVCDGMGGEELGEVASYVAVETLFKYHNEVFKSCNKSNIQKSIEQYIDDANERICEVTDKLNKNCIGTTLALVVIYTDYMYVYNLGDSKIFFISPDEIVKLSTDHTKAQMLYESGVIDVDELENSPSRHVLTQHLGISKNDGKISPSKVIFRLNKGDKFLICSDGVTDLLSENTLEEIIRDADNTQEAVHKIVDNSLSKGGIDNITALIINIEGKMDANKKKDIIKYFLIIVFLIIIIIGIVLLF